MLFAVGAASATEPSPARAKEPILTNAHAIELANAAAKTMKLRLDEFLAPKATCDPKTTTWRVYYGPKTGPVDGYLDIRVHDKTKETTLVPGG